MDRNAAFNIALASMVTISVWALSSLGGSGLDVYISVFALIYFACLAVFRPARSIPDLPAAALFVSFAAIVALRVMSILYGA
ncbi:MAG: hypothetical protein ABC595_03240 [Candidatus Methanosuratincola petrocarbonis]|nr:hypothetical protein [Candidatus Methanosuratincola sp.]